MFSKTRDENAMILTFYDLTSHDNGIMEKINEEEVHDEGISIEEFALPVHHTLQA